MYNASGGIIMDHNTRNLITDYKCSHKLYNPYLLDCYASLTPSSNSKIGIIIFNGILTNKQYYKENSTFFTESEAKRTYNSQPLSLDFILSQYSPSKYNNDKNAKANDIGNLVKKLKALEENNIFYIWRMGSPHVYMFFMERDIGLWKDFNPIGVVTPKTILKIAKQHKHCIDCMKKMLALENQAPNDAAIELSFCEFINKLIGKTKNNLDGKVQLWEENNIFKEYIDKLTLDLEKLDPFYGLEIDDSFVGNIPITAKWALNPKEAPKANKKSEKKESEFVQSNENIVKPKINREKITSNDAFDNIDLNEVQIAKPVVFETVNPFKNCNEFIKYYKDVLTVFNSSIRLPPLWVERVVAIEILDMLIDHKKDDIRFLKSWIGYFYTTKLNANNISNPEKTGLKKFKPTYDDFIKIYSEKTIGA